MSLYINLVPKHDLQSIVITDLLVRCHVLFFNNIFSHEQLVHSKLTLNFDETNFIKSVANRKPVSCNEQYPILTQIYN